MRVTRHAMLSAREVTATVESALKTVFRRYPAVKLAYLFGSRASGETGPRSDYDIAVYLDARNRRDLAALSFDLRDRVCRALGTDAVDLVLLNTAAAPELKYHIIRDGRLVFERSSFRVLVEPKILNEYFDFSLMLKRHRLTAEA